VSIETCDPLEALYEALCLELEGRAFYLRAAQRTRDEKGVAMFRSLADDERLHAEIVEGRMDALVSGEEWGAPECVLECDADLADVLFPRGEERFSKEILPDASDVDALLFALGKENDAYNYYLQQSKLAEDPMAKKMYEYLADSERTHFNLLMLNYESLRSKGAWAS
jgi:rubrerythrin